MSMAVSTALIPWSFTLIGAPQKAMIASPMNLSSVPSCSKITSTIPERYPFRISTTFSASNCSDMEVNPLMSEKRIVNLSLVPTSAFNTSSGDLSINMESIEGDTYWENIFFLFLLSLPSVMLRKAKEPIHEMTIEIVGATISNTILCLNHQKEADIYTNARRNGTPN